MNIQPQNLSTQQINLNDSSFDLRSTFSPQLKSPDILSEDSTSSIGTCSKIKHQDTPKLSVRRDEWTYATDSDKYTDSDDSSFGSRSTVSAQLISPGNLSDNCTGTIGTRIKIKHPDAPKLSPRARKKKRRRTTALFTHDKNRNRARKGNMHHLHNHAMTMRTKERWLCDNCTPIAKDGKEQDFPFGKDDTNWSCALNKKPPCDYDLCGKCFSDNQQEDSNPKASVSSS